MNEEPTSKLPETADRTEEARSSPVTGYAHFCCHSPGLVMEGEGVEQLPDGTWIARAKIGAIFGAEVEGECTGKGATPEEALAALRKDKHDLYESLWA